MMPVHARPFVPRGGAGHHVRPIYRRIPTTQQQICPVSGQFIVRGPPLDIWGEAWSFCLAIFIYFTREIESFKLFHLRIGWKYLFQYLYYIYFNLLCG